MFKIGEYVTCKGTTFHITTKEELSIVNENQWHFRKSNQEEIEEYHQAVK